MNFKRFLHIPAIAGALALASLGTASVAHAGNVFWSVGIASPGVHVGVANAPVYQKPVPVYVQPAPVYVQPAPIYYRPAPVYRGGYVAPVVNGPYYGRPHFRGYGYGHGYGYGYRHGYHDRNHNGVPDGHERHDNRGGGQHGRR